MLKENDKVDIQEIEVHNDREVCVIQFLNCHKYKHFKPKLLQKSFHFIRI